MKSTTQLVLFCACATTILLRIVPLPLGYNVSALGAMALLSGALVQRPWLAVLLPLGCRAATDLWLEAKTGYGFYNSMAFDYAAYALISLLGRVIAPRRPLRVVASGLLSATLFFLVSNLGVWLLAPEHEYTPDLSGLLLCYTKGIPFARGTFLGDVLFSAVFFGVWQFASSSVPAADVSADSATR